MILGMDSVDHQMVTGMRGKFSVSRNLVLERERQLMAVNSLEEGGSPYIVSKVTEAREYLIGQF